MNSSQPTTEYDTFKDFARRLVAVPKSEADEVEKTTPVKRTRKTKERESDK